MTDVKPPIDFASLKVVMDQDKPERALVHLHRYESFYPKDGELAALLGEAYYKLNNVYEAERYFRKTLSIIPKHLTTYTLLEALLREQGRWEECRVMLKEVQILFPGLKGVVTTSGSMIKLAEGNYLEGFKDYESRYSYKHMADAYAKEWFPRWKGQIPLTGKKVLLRYEQGLGDTLQFVRYAEILKKKGAVKVGVMCKEILHRLVEFMPSVDAVHSVPPTEGYNFEVMMMSMPAILKTAKDSDIPNAPYLSVREEDAKNWLEKMQPTGKLKVGMVWSGELKKALNWQARIMNARRSIPLEHWRPILDADCDFYCLQKGEREGDLKEFFAAHPIKNLMGQTSDFYDTACIIANLDLVITVDTSVAHLTGAMGKPTWVFHRLDGDWRWLLNRSDSPWYPSIEVFRQEQFEEWRPIVKIVAERLREKTNGHLWDIVQQKFSRESEEIPQSEKDFYKNLIKTPVDTPYVLNVSRENFAEIKNGDLVGLLNIIEHLRLRENNPEIKFFIEPSTLNQAKYCTQFYEFLKNKTNYLSNVRGENSLDLFYKSVWNYRMALGDVLKLNIPHLKQKKICVVPIFDAVTNPYRNWSSGLTQQIIDRFDTEEFKGYDKVICGPQLPKDLNHRGFKLSSDFMKNVEHILSCEYYIGGDTGLTHFASSLKDSPKLIYYLPVGSARNTYPMHFEQGEINWFKGE